MHDARLFVPCRKMALEMSSLGKAINPAVNKLFVRQRL